MVAEQVYRYPRWLRWAIELLCAAIVTIATVLAARDVMQYVWLRFGLNFRVSPGVPLLPEVVAALGLGLSGPQIVDAAQLLPSLGWLALALFATLLLRNSLPTIRTSTRGMLIEFGDDWLPVPWENVKTIKVTEDLGAEHFVLLAETNRAQLTEDWHRFYSLLYGLRVRPGFLITSAISNFDGLVKTLLTETDRVARVLENVKPAKLQEGASSPLFRFVLSPASFFSRRSKAELAEEVRALPGTPVRGTYPIRINAIFTWGTTLLVVVVLIRYLFYWLGFAALLVPAVRQLPFIDWLRLTTAQQAAPWWFLVAAHLMVILVIAMLVALRHLLPELEANGEGLSVRYFNRWVTVPWSRITAVKVSEFSEESQAVLIQTQGRLPFSTRVSSLIYDGSFVPGVLVTSAMHTFEPLLQRVIQEVTRYQSKPQFQSEPPQALNQRSSTSTKPPIFQDDAYSPMLMLAFRTASSVELLVDQIRGDETTTQLHVGRVLRSAGPMIWLALPSALLVFFDRAISQGLLPDGRLFVGMLLLFVLSLLEWPLISLATTTLDELTGGGEEGNRAFYLYPIVQLPRVLLLVAALLLLLLGVPALPLLLWLGAIVWSFLLSVALWRTLYGWQGSQLIAGGLLPALFQLLLLLGYLVALR